MNMKEILLNGFHLNMDYTFKLIEDVPDEKMAAQPNGFTNHPKFTVGHLITSTALTGKVLGEPYQVPEGWDELFRRKGPGDPRMPEKNKNKYPPKDLLQSVLNEKYKLVVSLIKKATSDKLSEKIEWRLCHYMPTVADVLFFQCHIHHSWHIGQLAEWRRLMNLDSALAKL